MSDEESPFKALLDRMSGEMPEDVIIPRDAKVTLEFDAISIDRLSEDVYSGIFIFANGQRIGLIDICRHGDNGVYLGKIEVDDDHQNKGFGGRALELLTSLLYAGGCKYIVGKIESDYWHDIDKLDHFYKKHGFEVSLDCENEVGTLRRDL